MRRPPGVITAATLKLKKPYTVKGRPIIGRTLTVGNGKFKPTTAAVTYQWVRNGAPITGANAATYVLTTEDVAQQVGVVVTGSLPNVAPISQGILLEKPVRSIPACTTRTQRKKGGKVIVHFELTAPGIAEPDGTVLIKVGSRERTITVKKGKAVARFVGVDPGRYRVRCQYAGSTLIEPGQAPRLGARAGQGSVREGLARPLTWLRTQKNPLAVSLTRPAGFCCGRLRHQPPKTAGQLPQGGGHPRGTGPEKTVWGVRARLTLVGSTKK